MVAYATILLYTKNREPSLTSSAADHDSSNGHR
jgi:hypothetical protein